MNRTQGKQVALRTPKAGDMEAFLAGYCNAEWKRYDAPFEEIETDRSILTQRFQAWCDRADPVPKRALIVGQDGEILGLVTRYGDQRFPAAWSLGVNIFREQHCGQGLGSEALALWIDWLFRTSAQHRLGLCTWSLNPRMIRTARSLGFRSEGVEAELVQWNGEWLDRHRFGLLRSEWEARLEKP